MICISLRLVSQFIDRIDAALDDLCLNRTAWIRRAIRRQLEYTENVELPIVTDANVRKAIRP